MYGSFSVLNLCVKLSGLEESKLSGLERLFSAKSFFLEDRLERGRLLSGFNRVTEQPSFVVLLAHIFPC